MISISSLSSLSSVDLKLVPRPSMFLLDFARLVSLVQMFESMILDFGEEMQKILSWPALSGNLVLRVLWVMLHLAVNIWYFMLAIVQSFESFLIASEALKKYKVLDISKVRYLAVVIDSEEARNLSKVYELLQWLVDIGVSKVCLYDPEGVLKKNKEAITNRFSYKKTSKEITNTGRNLTLEFLSFADGKEAVVKAANYLFAKHYTNGYKESKDLTEPQMSEALDAIGSGGTDPDLLLIYGPMRCHLGFPAWRIRYTEIVHMGQLKAMKYGALVKAIYRYTTVKQNYGS